MPKPVMIILPTLNGFVFMPFDSNLLTSFKKASDAYYGVRVSSTPQQLGEQVREFYMPDPPHD